MTAMQLTPREMSTVELKLGLFQAMLALLMANIVLGIHVVFEPILGPAGLVWLVGMTFAFFIIKTEWAYALLLVCMFFQNTWISIVSPGITTASDFNVLSGTSFLSTLLTSIPALMTWLRMRHSMPKEASVILRQLFFLMGVVALYSVLGLMLTSFTSVATYVRVYAVGGMMLAIGIAFGYRLPLGLAINVIKLLGFILVIWGIVEFYWPRHLYDAFNVADFLHLKFSDPTQASVFESVSDVLNFSNRSYLNLTGMLGLDLQLLRPNGPNIHPISYAYCVAFCGLVAFIYRSHALLVASLIIVLLIGAKGALIIMFVTLALYAFYLRTGNSRWLLMVLFSSMIGYAIIGIVYGLYTRDYHVIGLMGGLKGFLMNPLGHGIGVGGSMSDTFQGGQKNMQIYQGFGADYAFESAFGVVLYQIGVASVVFFYFCRSIWLAMWRMAKFHTEEPRFMVLPIVLALLFICGVFQEEALSPVAWGLWLFISGFLLSRHWQAAGRPLVKEVLV